MNKLPMRKRASFVAMAFVSLCSLLIFIRIFNEKRRYEVKKAQPIHTFEMDIFDLLNISYHSFVNSSSSEYNKDLETYVCQEIFNNLMENLKFYSKASAMNLAKEKLSQSRLKLHRRKIIHRLSREAAISYPANIDVERRSEEGIQNQIVFAKPINDLSIRYTLNPKNLCGNKDLYLLILIKSSVRHHHLRYVLRNTWVKEAYAIFGNVKVAFLVGYSFEEGTSMWIENFNFGDIIQGNFIDAYKNNTYKTIMAYRWVKEYCSNARFIFFVDDDMFVNVKLTEKFLKSINKIREPYLLSGMVVNSGRPPRELASPWFVSKDAYPFYVYPEYMAGCAMFLSQNVVRKFVLLFPYVKYFPYDDVYLGIVANKLGIRLHNNKYLTNVNIKNVSALPYMIANHGFHNEVYLLKTYGNFSEKDMFSKVHTEQMQANHSFVS